MASADVLVLLSDVDGLYTADPGRDPTARRLETVHGITAEIEAMAGAPLSAVGSGGMTTKIAAARVALAAGCHMAIASGRIDNPLAAVEAGAGCTWFVPNATPRTARKLWIGGTLKPLGSVMVDAGALKALARGSSLLPAGIIAIDGQFERGDAVLVRGPDGTELGRGLIAYSTDDARLIMGHRSQDIERILGYRGRDEMIHRDDLALNRTPADTPDA